MANTGNINTIKLFAGREVLRTDVEFVAKVSDAHSCELCAYKSEYPVGGDGGGCASVRWVSHWPCFDTQEFFSRLTWPALLES